MSVGFTAFHELIFERSQNCHLFLTHRFTEFVTLTTGEVRQQTTEEHDLLLVHRDTIGVLEVFLHDGDVIGHGFESLLTFDELRDIIHRSGTVEGVHSDEVADDGRF